MKTYYFIFAYNGGTPSTSHTIETPTYQQIDEVTGQTWIRRNYNHYNAIAKIA